MQRTESPVAVAIEAARWIRTAAVDDAGGRRWRANPDPDGSSAAAGQEHSLYSGAAGIVLFFLDLAAATGDDSYLADARRGGDYLAATWRQVRDPSLHHGLTGIAFALAEVGWATGEERFAAAAREAADQVVRSVRKFGQGIGWTGDPAQRGDGGIILGLLHAAGILGVSSYEQVAVEAGERIADLAVPGHAFGQETPDLPMDAVTPGFLSGTSGTAFLLARLYGVTKDERFLAGARRGADFVRTISAVSDKCALVPHHVPQARALHYLGFCSGSAGVARMFYELYRVTDDPGHLDWVERLARGIVNSGAPRRHSEGYWNVACQCCGAAGLLEFFVGLWAATGERSHLDVAGEIADELIGRATRGGGYRWYQTYRRLRPDEITADTGYLVGAAGIGAALLHLAAARDGAACRRVILLPDNPFPAIPAPVRHWSA